VLFYRLLIRLSRVVGLWIVKIVASIIAIGYFLLLPRRLAHSLRFYRALFPDRSWAHALGCAWRQYQDFARIYSERLAINRRTDVSFDCEGDEHLVKARAAGHGAILLMSHFGRWEIAARLLARRGEDLTLLMGGRQGGRGVDADLREAGLGVTTIPAGQGQAFDILEAVQVLRQGNLVSLAADRAWGNARMLRMPFLGRTVAVAVAPFALALLSGAPILTVFALRTGPRHYRFICDPPMVLAAGHRSDRQVIMEQAAAAYLDRLHTLLQSHPEQWQTFGRFFVDD
jgi:lauroyl/myristoyl acyltransferase